MGANNVKALKLLGAICFLCYWMHRFSFIVQILHDSMLSDYKWEYLH
jgi:hypothetical protein